MGDRYVKSIENKKKTLYMDANNLYSCAMSQSLPNDEIKFHKNFKLEDILITPDDSDVGYFIECDFSFRDNIREKIKNFPVCPENKISPQDNFSDYMNEMKPTNYTRKRKECKTRNDR